MQEDSGRRLRELVGKDEILVVPGIYDCISAKIAAEVGFEAIYVGSYGASAALLGCPDTGFIGRSEMVDQVWRISDTVDVPIIADGEGGWGNPIHVARTIREMERAGAAAVHIEDHEFGKHVTDRPILLSLDKAIDKLKAALDARRSDKLQIIARTDAMLSLDLGVAEAIRRANAFTEAGADMVQIPWLGLNDAPRVAAELSVPLVCAEAFDSPATSIQSMEEAGIKIVLCYGLAQFMAHSAIRRGMLALKRDGNASAVAGEYLSLGESDGFLGTETIRNLAERYHVL